MIIIIYIIVAILALWVTNLFATDRCRNKFDQEMKKCRDEYDYKISKLHDEFKKLSDHHKSLNSDHETLLNNHKDDEETHFKTRTEKYAAERRIADLQKELYCARKHTRNLTAQFISILAKLLGSK